MNLSAEARLGVVYVVDDDEAVRDSLQWLLEGAGYRVQAYDSAAAFLAGLDPQAIACLILDVRMPGMSGLQLQEELLRRGAEVPIAFVTGHGDVPMAVATMKKGAVDFIEKPVDQAQLKTLVEEMLARARAPEPGAARPADTARAADPGADRRGPPEQADRRRPWHLDQDR